MTNDVNTMITSIIVRSRELAILVACIPMIAFKKLSKKSVVDRLRVE